MLRLATPLVAALAVVLLAFSFRLGGTPSLPAAPFNYAAIALPQHLQDEANAEDNTPADNAITDAGATLGRVLFYDTRLSLTETTSCASCHRQEAGFSDPARFSAGHDGGVTARNSQGLAFTRYYVRGRMFWDERAATLEEQVLMPIQDPIEMGMTLAQVAERLEATEFYGPLFADAFGTPDVTPDRVSRALSQFVRSIVSPGSRYDAARAQGGGGNGPLPGLTAQENRGRQLFTGPAQCDDCHRTDLFTGDAVRNIGLDADTPDAGAGFGRFKSGSLRNVALTAPYMHDGRFETLADVVDFYSTGVQNHPNLDNRLRGPGGQPRRPNFSPQDKAALVAFLNTLTDPALATDERWSDPFPDATAGEPTDAFAVGLGLVGPNPFRGRTTLSARLRTAGHARVEAFDLAGRRVATILDEPLPAGERTIAWDASGLAAGIYVVRLASGGAMRTRTLTVLR